VASTLVALEYKAFQSVTFHHRFQDRVDFFGPIFRGHLGSASWTPEFAAPSRLRQVNRVEPRLLQASSAPSTCQIFTRCSNFHLILNISTGGTRLKTIMKKSSRKSLQTSTIEKSSTLEHLRGVRDVAFMVRFIVFQTIATCQNIVPMLRELCGQVAF
jgi:hypothetical protein